MIKASDFIVKTLGVKAKAGYIIKDSLSSSVLYFFNLSDSSVIPLSDVYIPDTGVGEPLYHGNSGGSATSMDFYKCAAVYSDSTWSGYKAVLNQLGYYEFETTATTGLEYTSVKPVVDGVYSADALIKATLYTGYPVNGLALYIPLKSAQSTAETGQTLSTTGTITYTTENSIPCAQLSYSSNIAISGSIQVGTGDFAISLWEKNTYWNDSSILWASSGNNARLVVLTNRMIQTTSGSGDTGRINHSGADGETWHHILFQRNNGTDYLYVDGFSVGTTSDTADLTFSQIYLGRWRSDDKMTGYLSSLRIYTRALSSAEIALLASEFTPTSN